MVIKLLPYLKQHRWSIVWALFQVLLIAGFELLKPWPLQIVIDNVLSGKPFPIAALSASPGILLLLASVGIVFVHFGAGALTLLHNYTGIRIGQNMVNDLRGTLYAHLQRLSLAFHSRQRVGDLLYRITADSFAVQTMIMNGALPILSALVLLAGMLVVLFPLDPALTILALTVVPVLFVLISLFNRRIIEIAGDVRTTESRVYSLVQWAMSSIKVVQAFTKEEEEHRRFMGASRESHVAAVQLADPLFRHRQPRHCRRDGARRLCRSAGCHLRDIVDRAADRIYLLPRPALCTDQPDYPELGADRGRPSGGLQDF